MKTGLQTKKVGKHCSKEPMGSPEAWLRNTINTIMESYETLTFAQLKVDEGKMK